MSAGRGRRPPASTARAIALVVLGVLALAAVGCSSGGSGASTPVGTAGGTAPPSTRAVEAFAGAVDDFYVVPDPLPAGPPGALIRTMPVDAPAGMVGLRVMYHATDAQGDDRAVTGLVYHPTAEAPAGGWPILAWAHGTSGLAPVCAPSRTPSVPPAFGVQGVLVATDYLGLGPVGELHPYLSAAAEGHAVIDGVAAARALPDAHAGDEWVVAGVSQGGHATLVTTEQAAERLPGVHLLGAVPIAPGAQLGERFGDDIQARIITTLVLAGVAAEDPNVDLADYVSPAVLPATEKIRTGCLQDFVGAVATQATSPDYFTVDPGTGPLGAAWLAANDPGQRRADPPSLLVQGGQDIVVLPARTDSLFRRLCGLGDVVERVDIPSGTHDSVSRLASDQIARWIADRFAGRPPANSC